MSIMDELAARQQQIGDEVQRLITNTKKDSKVRKTQQYFQDRLTRLEVLHVEFESIDSSIREITPTPLHHEYFSNGYYDNIISLINRYTEQFTNELEAISSTNTDVQSSNNKKLAEINTETQMDEMNHTAQGLIRKQAAMMKAVYRLLDTIDQLDDCQPLQVYTLKRNALTQLWAQVETGNYAICELVDNYECADYIQLETIVQEQVLQLTLKTTEQQAESTKVQLPKVTIPKFSGDFLQWRQFYDLFNQMIHSRELPCIQKMWYLKNSLHGEAEQLIRHLASTETNYNAAWQLLIDRFENKRILVGTSIQKLLSFSSMNSDVPSVSTLKSFHDNIKESILSLNNLGIDTTSWDPLLLHLLMKKLDKQTHMLFEQSLKSPKEIPSISEFLKFLEFRFQSLEAIGHRDKSRSASALTISKATNKSTCKSCGRANHQLFMCQKFLQLNPAERLQFSQRQNLCINCLKPNHKAKECNSGSCRICEKKHNTLLHLKDHRPTVTEPSSKVTSTIASLRPQPIERNHDTTLSVSDKSRSGSVLLGTAKVIITASNGKTVECRAILDSGSQVNLITEQVIRKLGANVTHGYLSIHGVGDVKRECHKRINLNLQSRINGFKTNFEAFILPKIVAQQPSRQIDISHWSIPNNIPLADPEFNLSSKVDVLIGAEFYFQLLSIGQIQLSSSLPILQNTLLGWVVSGKFTNAISPAPICGVCTDDEINQLIENFWKINEHEFKDSTMTAAEARCEAHFSQNTYRDSQGRYVVKLPFVENPSALGDSEEIARRRFLALERRLVKDESLKLQYSEFMNQYMKLGHMTEVNHENLQHPKYFIPHHCVIKPESSSTKLRVVFDASTKSSTNISLNDIMHVGPYIQADLFTTLLRFRLPRYVFTTDIEKMYRQIRVHPDDQRFQLIFWRESPDEKLKTFKLNTVTYGTRAAPYLAIKTLRTLAQDSHSQYPLGANVLLKNFYVDDGLAGSDYLIDAIATKQQLIQLMNTAGMKLRKWSANHPGLLQDVPREDQEIDLDFENECPEKIKTLGLTWLPKTDQFCITANTTVQHRITKRTVCADLAKIFDPLGLLAPVVVTAKMFVQELWLLKLDWDEALPAALHTRWQLFRQDIASLHQTKFPRHMFGSDIAQRSQLHIFCDASERAYGAVAYVRSILKNGRVIVRLLCARSKVAPLKKQTLPRLELCAAVMGAELASKIQPSLNHSFKSTHYWTDSEIVLAWVNSDSSSYHTFVANRISKLQELSSHFQWRHVRSANNPADVVSRGIKPNLIADCNIWKYGPLFLHGAEDLWPKPFVKEALIETDLEKKQHALAIPCFTNTAEDIIYKINHRNSFRTLQHVVAYVLRFGTPARSQQDTRVKQTSLTPLELDNALKVIIRTIQTSEFKDDIQILSKNKEVHKSSSLNGLNPFIDDHGIVRVGGRLNEASLAYDAKHQMLLPYNDSLIKLLLKMMHEANFHCGPQALLAIVRQRFWPIKGKIMARSIVQHCIRCNKAKPQLLNQMMGNLPASRIVPARPFITSGVDYCGPFWVHFKTRGKKPQKAYIAVFCCFKTKAVHLELVSELTTDAFIAALKRFISRRGHCQDLYSDNATNFVGAKNELSELNFAIFEETAKDKIMTECSNKGIKFHFIPPRAPHFGGLWEAAVKSAKHLLIRSTSTASLTYEELETVVVEIEAVLNSRPITPMSNSPDDLEYLTPGHFLIGAPLTTPIDPTATTDNHRLLTRWKLVSHIKHELWNRWVREYLNELQQRTKWTRQHPNIQKGDMVIVKEDNIPIMKWPLGRVLQTFEGKDGLVRVAEIKMKSGVYKRPIHKLALLPVETSKEEQPDNEIDDSKSNEPSHEEIPTKRRKLPGSVTTLFMCLLVLPTIFATKIENKQFGSNIGVHFESIGSTRITTSTWKLIIHYDLSPLMTERKMFYGGIFQLRNICDQLRNHNHCTTVLAQLEHLENILPCKQMFNTERRVKRGAVNVIGNVAHYLFGVLDSDYAEDMTNTISLIKQNENHAINLIKNQTSVVDSTLNIIKTDQLAVKERFDKINKGMNTIAQSVHDVNEATLQMKVFQTFISLAMELLLTGNNIYQIQSSIFDLVTDTHHGKISPLLLSPQQLQTEVTKIKTHLPTSLHLPVEQEDILLLYRLMTTINGGIANDQLVFTITLPLVDQGYYDIFRIIPIPTAKNDTMIAIDPCSDILAINPHRDQYFQLSEEQFSTCISTTEDKYICPNEQPRLNLGSNECACEVNLLNNDFKPICNIEKLKRNTTWIKINGKNQWIYALKNPIKVVSLCGQETSQLQLTGSGLLQLQPECTLRHQFVTINAHQEFSSIAKTSYTVLSNISDVTDPNQSTPAFEQPDLGQYHPLIKNLTELQKVINSQDIKLLPTKLDSLNIHHFSVGYTSLFISICVSIIILWKLTTRPKRPTPMPRNLNSSTTSDFTVHVT